MTIAHAGGQWGPLELLGHSLVSHPVTVRGGACATGRGTVASLNQPGALPPEIVALLADTSRAERTTAPAPGVDDGPRS